MSPLDQEMVRRKLSVISENLRALEPIRALTRGAYREDIYKRKATERLLQELIEAAIDINIHILTQQGHGVPDDYYQSFMKAGESKAISMSTAEKLAPSAGLRNRLVHEYDLLDHDQVLAAVKMAEDLYPHYIKEIEEYLSIADR